MKNRNIMLRKSLSFITFFVLCVNAGIHGQTTGHQLSQSVTQYGFPGRIVHTFLPVEFLRHLPLPAVITNQTADRRKAVPEEKTRLLSGPIVLFRALGPGEMSPAVGLETKPIKFQSTFVDLNVNIPPPILDDSQSFINKQNLQGIEQVLPSPSLKADSELLTITNSQSPMVPMKARGFINKVKKQIHSQMKADTIFPFDVPTEQPCLFKPYSADNRFFMQFVAPDKWIPRRCALGTVYNPERCDCSSYAPEVVQNSCKPEIYVNFTDGVKDSSGNQLPIGYSGVDTEAGHGKFNGNGRLLLWRYINFDFQMTLVMKLKFFPDGSGDKLQALISNCDWDPSGPSVGIIYKTLGSTIVFMIMTELENGTKHISLPVKANSWNSVIYTYDGKLLTGSVNDVTEKLEVTGAIQIRPSALVVGYCDQFGWYKGLLDDVAVYTCVPNQVL